MLGRQEPKKWLEIMPRVFCAHATFYDARKPGFRTFDCLARTDASRPREEAGSSPVGGGSMEQMANDTGEMRGADETSAQSGGTFVRSVARALKVISSYGAETPSQTVSQVAVRTGLDRATARRVLLTLEELRYLRRDGRLFSLTPLVLELGFAYLSSLPFWSVANDVVKELVDSLGAYCLIVTTDRSYDHVVVVSSIRPANAPMLAGFPDVGRRSPTHTVAPGIVLLGSLTGQDLNHALLACTAGDTGVTIASLRDRVIQDRRQGWSFRSVPEEDFCEIAVPLFDSQGRVIASMTVLNPSSTITPEDAIKLRLPRIRQAAEDINRLVGYRGP
jgi:IclR family pca regulon transcriptional regulator